jgi:hypothetical protein
MGRRLASSHGASRGSQKARAARKPRAGWRRRSSYAHLAASRVRGPQRMRAKSSPGRERSRAKGVVLCRPAHMSRRLRSSDAASAKDAVAEAKKDAAGESETRKAKARSAEPAPASAQPAPHTNGVAGGSAGSSAKAESAGASIVKKDLAGSAKRLGRRQRAGAAATATLTARRRAEYSTSWPTSRSTRPPTALPFRPTTTCTSGCVRFSGPRARPTRAASSCSACSSRRCACVCARVPARSRSRRSLVYARVRSG